MSDESDFLISQYEEHCEHGRHCETERSTVTAVVLAAQAAVFTYLGTKEFNCRFWAVEFVIPALSAYGFLATWQIGLRIDRHHRFIKRFREQLETLIAGAHVGKTHDQMPPRKYKEHWFWLALHATICIASLILILVFRCGADGPENAGSKGGGTPAPTVAVTIENNPTISAGPDPGGRQSPSRERKCSSARPARKKP